VNSGHKAENWWLSGRLSVCPK